MCLAVRDGCMVVINQSNTVKMNVSDLKHSLVMSLCVCVCVCVCECWQQ